MAVVEDLAKRLARVEEQVHQMILRALVTQVDGERYMVKVKYPAQDSVESGWLQVLTTKSHQDKYFSLPDIDEQVLVFHIPGAQDVGYVLSTSYSTINPVPKGADSPEITMINWGEGSWFKHNRETGDVDLHVTGKLTIAVGGDIKMGSGGSININAADKITVKAPNEITLGDATTININSKTDTNIVGSTNLTLMSTAKSELYSDTDTKVKAGAELTLSGGGNAYLTAGAVLHCHGTMDAHYGSDLITSVYGGPMLLLGAETVQTSGINLVEMAERVTATMPPVPAETKPPASPGTDAAGLPADTVVEPQPIEPEPYEFDPPPEPGPTPKDPGPTEGPTSKAQVGAGGKKQ